MAWNDASELIVAGDGQAYIAPVGTALPNTGPTQALNSAFEGLGYHTEDGASFKASPDIQEFMAWQSRQAIRRELKAQELSVQFVLQQWDEDSVPFAFGGGVVTDLGGGNFRYDFPDDTAQLQEKALILDVADGSVKYRFVFPRGNVTEDVESEFKRDAAAGLPITWKALEPTTGGSPGYFLTNASYATGS